MGGIFSSAGPNAEFPDSRATLECKCGKAKISFRNYSSRMRIECACFSCRQRQEWSHAHNDGVEEYQAPSDLTWLDNAITDVRGREHLVCNILRAGSDSRWLATTCCQSVLCVTNPLYRGNVIAAVRNACNLKCHEAMPAQVRIQTREWAHRKVGDGYTTEENMQSRFPFAGGVEKVFDGRSMVSMLWGLYKCSFLQVMGTTPYRGAADTTIEGLIGELGPVVDLGVKEYTHITADALKPNNSQ